MFFRASKEAEMYTGKKVEKINKNEQIITQTEPSTIQSPLKLDSLSREEAEGFFSNLVESHETERPEAEPLLRKPSKDAKLENLPMQRKSSKDYAPPELVGGTYEQISKNMNWNEGVERIIKQNLLAGNLQSAIDCCLKCGRTVF